MKATTLSVIFLMAAAAVLVGVTSLAVAAEYIFSGNLLAFPAGALALLLIVSVWHTSRLFLSLSFNLSGINGAPAAGTCV